MNKNQLKKTLASLHADLESGGTIDPELKDLLELLEADIQQLLGKDDHDEDEAAGVGARAEAAAARFDADHPHIAPILRELADVLGRMGI